MAILTDMMSKIVCSNAASSSGSGTPPSNTITNPKEELKGITTRSCVFYQGPTIPTPSKQGTEEKLSEMDKTPMNEHCLAIILNKFPRKLRDPGKFLIPCEFPGMDECLALVDLGASINLMPFSMWEGLSLLELTPTCMTLKLADRSVSKPIGITKDVLFKVGVFHFPADFVVVDFEQDPQVPLILGRCFLKTGRALIDVHKEYSQEVLGFSDVTASGNPTPHDDPIVELKELPPDLEYAFLVGDNKFPVIIAKELGDEEKSSLIKILMEEDYKPAVQHQRQVNPKIHDVVKKEVEKLLDAGLIYPISNSPWVSPGSFKFPLTLVIRIKQRSPVHTARLPIDACLSVCAMHQALFKGVMLKYGVTHRLSTAYHPQTSGQVEVSNRGLKRILERTIGENSASWSDKLDYALWAFRTAYKTPIGCTPYKLVYGKACYLPIELKHKANWALKQANFDLAVAGDHQKIQLNELNKIRDHAYGNSLIYKEKMKRIHDSKNKNRVFNVGDRVILFNSRLKIFSGKLKTCWSGPFTIVKVFLYGTVELSQANGPNFKVNGHRVKHYFGGDVPQLVVSNLQTFPWNQ
nr:reverse transcriptase domain-containing protein [Tanacetum cinerariifolium]